MSQSPAFDKQEQFDKIAAGLIKDEQILAVYDCTGAGTGFVGVTNKRVILQDNSFIGKQVALSSVPYSRVNSVSFVSDKSMLGRFASSSTIALHVGSEVKTATFRGEEKAKYIHDTVLWHIL